MKIYICSSLGQMMEEIKEVNPTILCAVPLIYERIYATCKQYNIAPTKIFGDNIRYLFCGGAWFDPEIRRFFKSYDITLLHSYGLSETSSIVCVEYPNSTDFTSVGTVFENMTVKIDNPNEDGVGEIIVKGDNVFKGYYKNPEATNRAFDDCGFFHTGDLGRLEGNLLYNYGRIKKVIVLSNGENVYPDEIISVLKTYPGVSGARVFEKDRKIFATIYYNKEIDAYKIIESVNEQLPKHSRIQAFELIEDSPGARMK
jgi:long-chain acyl-CoA synthetase